MTGAYSRNKGKRAEYWQTYAAKRREAKALLPKPAPPAGNWKFLAGGLYAVSDDGRVWSQRYARLLAGSMSRDGYRKVQICADGKARHRFVHGLVAEQFVDGVGGQVRHLDGDKLNNRASNLSWGTCQQNIHDKWAHGKMVVGEKHHNNKIPEADIPAIRASVESNTAIASRYGVSRTAIYLIKKGKNYGWL